ncbi:MAG: hypothetical protein HQM02_13955 [Magnetococcales bacterium]|nr:hypothetical protein [Magnetococcales bacterium]
MCNDEMQEIMGNIHVLTPNRFGRHNNLDFINSLNDRVEGLQRAIDFITRVAKGQPVFISADEHNRFGEMVKEILQIVDANPDIHSAYRQIKSNPSFVCLTGWCKEGLFKGAAARKLKPVPIKPRKYAQVHQKLT